MNNLELANYYKKEIKKTIDSIVFYVTNDICGTLNDGNSLFPTNGKWHLKTITSNSVTLLNKYFDEYEQHPITIIFRDGSFSFANTFFGPTIECNECNFEYFKAMSVLTSNGIDNKFLNILNGLFTKLQTYKETLKYLYKQ